MADAPGTNIDRYIQLAFQRKIDYVFGVSSMLAYRPDYSDAIQKQGNRNAQRAATRAFIRPISFELKEDGFRNTAMAGRGLRHQATLNAGSPPSHFEVVHPMSIITTYEVAIEVSSVDQVMTLSAIWMAARVTHTLGFKMEYRGVEYTIVALPETQLSIPEFQGPQDGREDVARTVGNIEVQGYSCTIEDPHVVPVILDPQLTISRLDGAQNG